MYMYMYMYMYQNLDFMNCTYQNVIAYEKCWMHCHIIPVNTAA